MLCRRAKAWYRKALALQELDSWSAALEASEQCLDCSDSAAQQEVQQLKDKLQQQQQAQQAAGESDIQQGTMRAGQQPGLRLTALYCMPASSLLELVMPPEGLATGGYYSNTVRLVLQRPLLLQPGWQSPPAACPLPSPIWPGSMSPPAMASTRTC
jgi:hypothetical protein